MPSRWLDTTTNMNTFLASHIFVILIDGTEYTAIKDREYTFSTKSPSRVVQEGFDYGGHSVIQPCTVSYKIVVSKIDKTELSNILKLFNNKKIFTLENPVYTIKNCIITSISIADTNIDAFELTVDFTELNSSIQMESDSSSSFQLISGKNVSCGAAYAEESNGFECSEKNTYDEIYTKQVYMVELCVNSSNPMPYTGDLPPGNEMKFINPTNVSSSISQSNTHVAIVNNRFVCI